MQLRFRQLARGIAFVVRKEFDCHVVCLRRPITGGRRDSKADAVSGCRDASWQMPGESGLQWFTVQGDRDRAAEMITRVHAQAGARENADT
jgi:hypothetical protein